MKLRNVIFKTKNIIIQEVRKSTDCACKTCIIMESSYSLSVDEESNVIHKDPLFFPQSGNAYGDYTVLSLFYPFECEGLSEAAKELANYIDTNMYQYQNIILHGHSKCGSCFIEATKWLKRRVTVVSVSASLNSLVLPMFCNKIIKNIGRVRIEKCYSICNKSSKY